MDGICGSTVTVSLMPCRRNSAWYCSMACRCVSMTTDCRASCLFSDASSSSSSFTDLVTLTRGLFLIVFALLPKRIVDTVSA